jgi:hypothetical protein
MRKLLGFLAVAGLLVIAAPAYRAEASVLAPGVATTVQGGVENLTTDVRYRRFYGPRRYYGPRVYAPRRYYAPRVFVPRVFAPRRYYY